MKRFFTGMNKNLLIASAMFFLLACGGDVVRNTEENHTPIPVILDTDIDSDVDDVGALAMLHAYERAGKARILGIIVTSDDVNSLACTDAINTYFGRGDIPLAACLQDTMRDYSRYTKAIAQEFSHQFHPGKQAEESTVLYRRLLVGSPDTSVVIVTIGHLSSLSRLLDSPPDSLSPLDGTTLVAQKVKHWSCMGGRFPSGKEANFYRPDPQSTLNSLAKWPAPVTFAGWETGSELVTGGARFKDICPQESPVYRAYELFNNFEGRASWDQVAVLQAVEAEVGYFLPVTDGYCYAYDDGSNEWRQPPDGRRHGYLTIRASTETIRGRIEALMAEPGKPNR